MTYLVQLVGYKQAGIPVKLSLSKDAKDIFHRESINQITPAFGVVGPHMLFQLGSLVHVFPVLGIVEYPLGIMESTTATSSKLGALTGYLNTAFSIASKSAVEIELAYYSSRKRSSGSLVGGSQNRSFFHAPLELVDEVLLRAENSLALNVNALASGIKSDESIDDFSAFYSLLSEDNKQRSGA